MTWTPRPPAPGVWTAKAPAPDIWNDKRLLASALVLGAPVLGRPGLEQVIRVHPLAASPLVTAPPALSAPAMGQGHALAAVNTVTEPPVLGSPSIGGAGLVAVATVTGAPVLGTPGLGQVHALGAVAVTTGAAVLGAPTLWNPKNLGANLWTWWDTVDAATVTQASGAASAWADKSGRAHTLNQATAASQALYRIGADGRPEMVFDGVDDFMRTGAFTNLPQPFVVFMALKSYAGPTGDANLYRGGDQGAVGFRLARGADWSIFAGSVFSSTAAHKAGPTIRGDYYAGINSEIRSDGTAFVGDAGATLGLNASPFTLGANSTNGFPASMTLGEVVIAANPTLLERQQIEGYMAHRWGTAASLPAGHPYKSVAP